MPRKSAPARVPATGIAKLCVAGCDAAAIDYSRKSLNSSGSNTFLSVLTQLMPSFRVQD